MLREHSFYHGAFLHELALAIGHTVCIESCDSFGRPNTFVLNDRTAVILKHSTKRLTPWQFTFTKEHLAEIQMVGDQKKEVFGCFVCGKDGIACLPARDLVPLISAQGSNQCWLRIERKANKMYKVSGANGELPYKIARGLDAVIDSLSETR